MIFRLIDSLITQTPPRTSGLQAYPSWSDGDIGYRPFDSNDGGSLCLRINRTC
jgi:hypothetical protein